VGGLAALLFLSLGFPGGPAPFLVLERVDMLGVTLAIAAVAVLSHGTDRAHVLLAAALAGVAVMTKQSLFAAALAGTVWLSTFNLRKAALFGSATAIVILIPAAVFQWTSGGAFWQNIGPDNPDPSNLATGSYLFRELLTIQGVPILLTAYYAIGNRAWVHRNDRLLLVYWLASAISIVGLFKVGANHNYWIELAAATAVLAALGLWRTLQHRNVVAAMLPLMLVLIGLGILLPARFIQDRDYIWLPLSWTLDTERYRLLAEQATGFQHLVTDVGGESGELLAEAEDIVVLGNHPVQFEPFAFSMLETQRRWNSDPLVDDICSGRIKLLVLVYPIESNPQPVGLPEFPMWPASVMTALRSTMEHEQTRDWHFLYRPKKSLDAASIADCKAAAAAARP
jgi:hypothetical protein